MPFSRVVQNEDLIKINTGKNVIGNMKLEKLVFIEYIELFKYLEYCDNEFMDKMKNRYNHLHQINDETDVGK